MERRNKIKPYTDTPITHQILMESLVEYNRPNDKISQWIKDGTLIALRRGMYIPGEVLDLPRPHDFVIANVLRGPSYVSLESALSYWGMIPERVYETSSITLQTSTLYDTPIGRFSYRVLSAPYYSFGIQRIEITPEQAALIASPEKALCDKIVTTSGVNLRSIRQTFDFLTEDLRIDEDTLSNLNLDTIESWLEDAPKRASLQMLIHTIRSL